VSKKITETKGLNSRQETCLVKLTFADTDHLRARLLRHVGGQPVVGPVREHPLAGLGLALGLNLHSGS